MQLRSVAALLTAVVFPLLIAACDGAKHPVTPGPSYSLSIWLIGEKTHEAPINHNAYIGGRFTDSRNTAQSGVRVFFEVDPITGGADITPMAMTEPDSTNGFSTLVTFFGRHLGTVLIRAYVNDATGGRLATDTLNVEISSGNW